MSGPDRQNPKGADRAEQQRHRILDAAEKCFIEHGFHAASMANIAEAAKMSPGLIYRYFENKDSIILTIIERQLQERQADIATLQTDRDLCGRICKLLNSWNKCEADVMNPALFLEMSAEASRNPEIARALGNADQLCRSDFSAWLKRLALGAGHDSTDRDIQRRALALQCLVEGLAIRTVREPGLDASAMAECIKLLLPHILSFGED